MSLDSLLKFRETYLRAIAQAWHDPSFFDFLIDHPIRALHKFGFHWPWQHLCDLAMVSAGDRAAWLDHAWVTSPDQIEMLRLHFPLVPVMRTPGGRGDSLQPLPRELMAMALADYYRQRAVLFTDDPGSRAELQPGAVAAAEGGLPAAAIAVGVIPTSDSVEPYADGRIGLDSRSPTGGFAPAHNTFESFQVVVLAAIALAWRSRDYQQMLEIDAAAALHKIRDFRLPWRFRLVIANDLDTYWSPPVERDHEIRSGWHNCKNHRLTMIVPRPPEVKFQAVALAAYNAAGAAYPFTCCL